MIILFFFLNNRYFSRLWILTCMSYIIVPLVLFLNWKKKYHHFTLFFNRYNVSKCNRRNLIVFHFFIIHFLSLLALHLYFLKSKEWRIPKRHEGVPELQEECGGVHGHHGGVQWPHSGDQEQQGRGVRRSPTAGVRRRVLTSRYPWTQLLIQVLTSP